MEENGLEIVALRGDATECPIDSPDARHYEVLVRCAVFDDVEQSLVLAGFSELWEAKAAYRAAQRAYQNGYEAARKEFQK